jgi:amidase
MMAVRSQPVAKLAQQHGASADAAFASASEHAVSVRQKEVSSSELTALYYERIRKYNTRLNAIVCSNETDALRTARERDHDLTSGIVRGPLHGVPVTVKESFDLAGSRTTVNFSQLKANIAGADALAVRRLKDAGAIILGKTNVPMMLADYQTFGPLYPTANNPHDPSRTPGGSTGGGAAAVAAGLTALEIGSDLAGSIRLPAHFCGVFGLKPSENTMHAEGHVPPLPGSRGGFAAMVSIGPLARTMADIELAWNVINQPAWRYPFHVPARPRQKTALRDYKIGWFDDVGPVACGDDTKKVLGEFLQLIEGEGVVCEKSPFDVHWLNEAYAVWGLLFGAMAAQDTSWIVRRVMNFQFRRMQRGSALNVFSSLKAGLEITFKEFSRALKRRQDLVRDLQARFDVYDFIVSPVAAGPAFAHNPGRRPISLDGRERAYIDYAMPFTIIYNACGNPALVVPAGRSAEGLPIGIQIAAAHYAEAELIQFGNMIERLGVRSVAPTGYA